MIKSELVQRIADRNPHLYLRDVEKIVNAILDEIVKALARGDRVELRGFGAFSVKHRDARPGRNPRTGAHVPSTKKPCRSSRPARKCANGSMRRLSQLIAAARFLQMKRLLEVLILLPLAIIGLALAVANRHAVMVSFDPFTSTSAGAVEAPLFIVLIVALIVGVLLGGFFTWLSQGKHRRALRGESRRGRTAARPGHVRKQVALDHSFVSCRSGRRV